jgi:hypothetical protein
MTRSDYQMKSPLLHKSYQNPYSEMLHRTQSHTGGNQRPRPEDDVVNMGLLSLCLVALEILRNLSDGLALVLH